MDLPRLQMATSSTRTPLGETTQRGNIIVTPRRNSDKKPRDYSSPTSRNLPHHESLMPDAGHSLLNTTSSPNNGRLSAPSAEQPDSKRNSQISTTSTNASSKGRKKKTHIGPWQLGADIGKGGVGKVRKVRHSLTGQDAAVKIIAKKMAEEARATSLANLVESSKRNQLSAAPDGGHLIPFGVEREIVIMRLLEHPNIVRLYDVWENRNELYLVMEYINGGELFQYIADSYYLEEDETCWLFRQMVAALLHCHSLGIHHRDLKPENILLDRDTSNVKIADFGMAALQPEGKKLTTPCGSVHYAAPEVFERSYDGRKADVWSLGVILYIMLTGTTPFQYDPKAMERQNMHWHQVIKSAHIDIPEHVSIEAKDLIHNMLRPDPKSRFSLDKVWKHPFMHKYRAAWGETEETTKLENWIGPVPSIDHWNIKHRNDVDREILRNLRTLWHSDPEEMIINKLLSKEYNLEKYFYHALERHREEQLENYVGNADGVGYSASDHHHIKSGNPTHLPPLRKNAFTRTKSQFSILNDDYKHSKGSLRTPPASVGSYDPFRASRDPIIGNRENYVNVTVHRGASRRPGSTRVEALKRQQRHLTVSYSTTSLQKGLPERADALYRRSMSRSSLASSLYPSSPPVAGFRASVGHKRGVNFSHLRRSSTASALTVRSVAGPDGTPQKLKQTSMPRHGSAADIHKLASSPAVHAEQVVRSRKENRTVTVDTEARKVSTELEEFMDRAFNRASTESSNRISVPSSRSPYDTPPSSISNRASGASINLSVGALKQDPKSGQRVLPDIPSETPNTFIARELTETRQKLAARYAQDENAHNGTYSEVLAHLDALLQPVSAKVSAVDGRRSASAPDSRFPEYPGYLPIISEESRHSDTPETPSTAANVTRCGNLTKSALAGKSSVTHIETYDSKGTIRLIEQSSPPRIAPLVIRKASTINSRSQSPSNDGILSSRNHDSNYLARSTTPLSAGALKPILEEGVRGNVERISNGSTAVPKKMGWFARRVHDFESGRQKNEVSNRWRDPDDPTERRSTSTRSPVMPMRRHSSNASMNGGIESQPPAVKGKRPGFLSFLWKGRTNRRELIGKWTIAADEDDPPTTNSTSALSSSDRTITETSPESLGVQLNWLSRFLHIKPAMRTLCFRVGRGKARQEIVRLLRSWRNHGIREVTLDRERNIISGRLIKQNTLRMREVGFVVELFVVLHRGTKKGLCLTRWTQRNGAVSSFRAVVDGVEYSLGKRGVLVTADWIKADMADLLNG